MIGKLLCLFGRHKLHSLKRLGVSEHIACERCFKQFGINHSVRGVIPWTADLADMYWNFYGYNDRANFAAWRKHLEAQP